MCKREHVAIASFSGIVVEDLIRSEQDQIAARCVEMIAVHLRRVTVAGIQV